MAFTVATFIAFTVLVAVLSWWKTRDDDLSTKEGYFLAGRGLPGIVIAGSLMMTNLSAEQLVGHERTGVCGQHEYDGLGGHLGVRADRAGVRVPAQAATRRHRHHPGVLRDALRYLHHAPVLAAVSDRVCRYYAADHLVFGCGRTG